MGGAVSIRVVVADDHKVVREGLISLLANEADIEVVGEAENGRCVVRMVEECSPDVVIMDVSMPGLNGIEATRQIVSRNPSVKVLALSMYSDRRFITSMMKAGASGYLVKDCAFNELVEAIRALSMNRTYLSRDVADAALQDYVSLLRHDELSVSNILTSREREVLQLVSEGKKVVEIAFLLNLSVKTVETHRQAIMRKLNIHTVAGLTKYALRESLPLNVQLDSRRGRNIRRFLYNKASSGAYLKRLYVSNGCGNEANLSTGIGV